jgi:ribosomal protein S12 methylthiotransferase accessory factor YcaO
MDPIEQKHRHPMRAAMDALKEVFPGMGITLMVFNYGDMSRMNYISTAKREDMLKAMKGFIARHEGRMMEEPDKQS